MFFAFLSLPRVFADTPTQESSASSMIGAEGTLPSGTQADEEGMLEPEGVVPSSATGVVLRSLRIAGSALRPRDSTVTFGVTSSGGCIYATGGPATEVFNVPVILPYGSTVKGLRMYYNDTDAVNSRAWFTQYDLYGTIVAEWSVDSAGSTGQGFATTNFTHTLNYESYSYLINWRPYVTGTSMQLCGFRIFYEPPPLFGTFLPSIQKN